MQVSAEVRWFWPNRPADGLERWFVDGAAHAGVAAGGGDLRVDEYLVEPAQVELGIKSRGGKKGVEVKGLVAVSGRLGETPFEAPVELWTKWTSAALALPSGSTVRTEKRRWLRKFDGAHNPPREIALGADERPKDSSAALPARGCNVELTHVLVAGERSWWSFGFESFGTVSTVEKDLAEVARLLAHRRPPSLPGGQAMSYPAWLSATRSATPLVRT